MRNKVSEKTNPSKKRIVLIVAGSIASLAIAYLLITVWAKQCLSVDNNEGHSEVVVNSEQYEKAPDSPQDVPETPNDVNTKRTSRIRVNTDLLANSQGAQMENGCMQLYTNEYYPNFSFQYNGCEWEFREYRQKPQGINVDDLEIIEISLTSFSDGTVLNFQFVPMAYANGYGSIDKYGYCSTNDYIKLGGGIVRESLSEDNLWFYIGSYEGDNIYVKGTENFNTVVTRLKEIGYEKDSVEKLTFCTDGGAAFLTDTAFVYEHKDGYDEELKAPIGVTLDLKSGNGEKADEIVRTMTY